MNKPDITKTESGLQQNDGLKPSREPEISYSGDSRLKANDIGTDRSEKEDNALKEAMVKARNNRRDQPQESLGSDASDFNVDTDTKH